MGEVLTVSSATGATARQLRDAGVEAPQMEAESLVGAASGRGREWAFLHPGAELSADETARLKSLTARRCRREPLPYILGQVEFFGLSLRVTPAAPVPRPETEILVEAVAARARDSGARLAADVGSGSGAVAVALAAQIRALRVLALDVSPTALRLTRENRRSHGMEDRVVPICSDLLGALRLPLDCVAANLPYIRTEEFAGLQPEVRDFEPRAALDGGEDGLCLIRRLCGQLVRYLHRGGFAALEVGAGQAAEVAKLLETGGLSQVETLKDYAGIERVMVGWRRE